MACAGESAPIPSGKQPSRFVSTYRTAVVKKVLFIVISIAVTFVLMIYSATLGSFDISAEEVFSTIWGEITMNPNPDATVRHIVIDLRLPRILGAVICGFALAVCGTAMQSMMKNPLADPYTMGISSGASLGAALAIILGFELVAGGGIVLNAFVFATVPALIILSLSRFRKATPTRMILCGISMMYIFGAITQLFMIISDPEDLSAVYQWMVGTLEKVDAGDLFIILIVTVLGSIYVQYMANQLNIMGVGDESAKTLGVDVDRKRLYVLLTITLMAAAVVSFTGVIGFVGLISPHIVRTVIGADNKFLIPAAGVFGSVILLGSDIVARTVVAPQMLPVGVITACIGGPLFMFLLLKGRKETWS